jgi:uncharacterized protein with FMN-binding domain
MKPRRNGIYLAAGLILASAIYAYTQFSGAPHANSAVANVNATQMTPANRLATATGQYADGTYTGSAADAYYGTIQVRAVVLGGKIADVQFLQYPNDRRTSIDINSQAMPLLKNEAIKAQSAQVDIVSGATDSSQAFRESLSSALSQAQG